MSELKTELHRQCTAFVLQRMENAKQALLSAEQSATEDTKSSAGDKYETGREMMQQESTRNMIQLNEANKLLVALNRISTTGQTDKAEEGSMIITNNGNFYISVSAGALTVDGRSYFAISAASPIGVKMMGCKAGDGFSLNGAAYQIINII